MFVLHVWELEKNYYQMEDKMEIIKFSYFRRSSRRWHRERLKKNRAWFWYWGEKPSDHLGMLVNTPKPCSSWCCGNPRKWFKKRTLAEKARAEIDRILISERIK
jgi:hypothetical protein